MRPFFLFNSRLERRALRGIQTIINPRSPFGKGKVRCPRCPLFLAQPARENVPVRLFFFPSPFFVPFFVDPFVFPLGNLTRKNNEIRWDKIGKPNLVISFVENHPAITRIPS